MWQYEVDHRGQKGMGAEELKKKLLEKKQMYFSRDELIDVGEEYHLSSDEVMRLAGQLRHSEDLLYLSEECWYLREYYCAQREATALLAKRISRSNQSGFKAFCPITLGNGIVLSRQQMKAINGVLQYNISVITGCAGTGKTAVIQGLCICAPEGEVLLCAPTGKASINLKEKTGFPSYTIDRLKAHPEWDVFKGRSIVIVDEAGMMDILGLQFLLKNTPEEAHLILLGDEEQLPSMGPGNVLRNIREAGIPSFRLTEIFRQRGGLTELMSNLMKCVNRQPYLSANHDGTFEILPHNQNALLKRTVDCYAAGENVQVICPYKKYADILSKLISKCLYSMKGSPLGVNIDGMFIWNGEKILIGKNDYLQNVFNGEIVTAKVEKNYSGDNRVSMITSNGKEIFDFSNLNIMPAYAMTVHKTQGSEYDTVLFVLSKTSEYKNRSFLNRNLLYTALSRAKKRVLVYGSEAELNEMIKTDPVENKDHFQYWFNHWKWFENQQFCA